MIHAVIMFFIVILIFLTQTYGGDSTFPIIGGNLNTIESNSIFLRHREIFGMGGMLDVLRSTLIVIFSKLNLDYRILFLSFLLFIGYIGMLLLGKYLITEIYYKKFKIQLILLSLFYVINPLTINHLGHHFIIQGYVLYPFIVLFYLKFIDSKNIININLLLLVSSFIFLGQPHNYANVFYIMFYLFIITIFTKGINYKTFIVKNLIILIFSFLIISHIILSFKYSLPNDLTSSVKNFSGGEANMIWSSNQGVINTLLFKMSFFNDNFLYLLMIIINTLLLGFILFFGKNSNSYTKILITGLILISLSFISKNIFFENILIRELIYIIMPHLRVDVAYIIMLFIFGFIISLIIILKYIKEITFITIAISINLMIVTSVVLLKYDNNVIHIDKEKYLGFTRWLNNNINNKSLKYVITKPLSVTFNVPGVKESIYPGIFTDNMKNITNIHWNFKEGSFPDTSNFLSNNDIYSTRFISKTNIKYILCFKDCQFLNYDFKKISDYENKIFLYEYIDDNSIIILKDGFFKGINPTKYKLHLNNISGSQKLSFLQSFHKGWKLYIKPNKKTSWCNPIEKYNIYGNKVTECEHNLEFFEGEELSYLYKNPIFENTHYIINDYANGWTISKDKIVKYVHYNYSKELKKEGYPKTLDNGKIDYKYYTLNPDGSIDVEFTLYFKPQSYFYLGLIISGTTFVLLLGYLGLDVIRNRRKNKVETIEKNQSI